MLKGIVLFLCLVISCNFLVTSQDFSYKEKKELKAYNDYIMQAEYSPFRNYFAITIGDNTIEIYDKNWNKIFTHKGNPDSRAGKFSFSPNEKYLAFSKYKSDKDVAIVDLENKKVIQVLTGHEYYITDISYSNNGKFLATGSQDNTMRLWKLKDDVFLLHQVLTEHKTGSIQGLSFSYNDNYLASAGGNDYKAVIRELKGDTYEFLQEFPGFKGTVRDVAFNPSTDELIIARNDDLRILKKSGNKFVQKIAYTDVIDIDTKIEYSPNGKYVVFGDRSRLKIFENTKNGLQEAETIYRHSDYVFGGTFSLDGKFLVSYSSDKSAVIWEITGVNPSGKSQVVDYLGDELSSVQKEILITENISEIMGTLSKSQTSPRDEFETSQQYTERRKKLSGKLLFELQKRIESCYNIKYDSKSGKVIIPVQGIVGYNADLQMYKIRFLETTAGVEIGIPDAKELKKSWKRYNITASKKIRKDGLCYEYSDFKLISPDAKKTFRLIPSENPFHLKVSGRKSKTDDLARMKTQPVDKKSNKQSSAEKHVVIALLFANNIYDSYSDLINPVFDMNTIAEELRTNYAVQTEVIENATLNEILNKLRDYAKYDYDDNESLIIFFAGHGNYDEIFNEGYVIAADSKLDDEAKITCLSHSNLRTIVNNIPCNHILLIMDVCFGGTFDPLIASRSRAIADIYVDVSDEEFISRKQKYKTRLYLTSGGKDYVPDGRPGYHSPFARRFVESLRNYGGKDGILTINEILQYIEKVEPQPCFGEFGDNEPGSDFILIAR